MKRLVIVVILTAIYFPGKAQLNNNLFEWPRSYDEADSGRFYAGFRTLGFLRNDEYFNKVLEGYTLFGYQVNPFIAWQAGRHVRIEGGIYLAQSFGEDDFSEVLPTFTFVYRRKNHQVLFGTLQGNLSHRLIEPLYDFENVMWADRMEYGLQYRLINENVFLDTWIDWRSAIEQGDTNQEEFVAGLSGEYKWLNTDPLGFSSIFQITAMHRGGQINESDLPVVTLYNVAFGLKGWVNRTGFITKISADAYYVGFRDDGGITNLPFDEGNGFYANAFLESKWGLGLMISYWSSDEYYSPTGGRIYQNYSYLPENYASVVENRELLFFRFLYDKPLGDGIRMGIRGEPFLDIDSGELEWTAGFYLSYDIQFRLGKRALK